MQRTLVGELVRERVTVLNKTLADVAAECAISQSRFCAMVLGQRPPVGAEQLRRIAAVLDLDFNELRKRAIADLAVRRIKESRGGDEGGGGRMADAITPILEDRGDPD